jgi:hypothetical protein
MYPVDFDVPLPIATRTRRYLNSAGLVSTPPPNPGVQPRRPTLGEAR